MLVRRPSATDTFRVELLISAKPFPFISFNGSLLMNELMAPESIKPWYIWSPILTLTKGRLSLVWTSSRWFRFCFEVPGCGAVDGLKAGAVT